MGLHRAGVKMDVPAPVAAGALAVQDEGQLGANLTALRVEVLDCQSATDRDCRSAMAGLA
jgi:hypothetical protein